MQRIDILTFQDNFLYYYSNQWQKAFESFGIQCRIFDIQDGYGREYLQQIMRSPPDALFGVSTLFSEPILFTQKYEVKDIWENPPTLLCDHLQIPYFSFHIDPPLHYAHHLFSDYSHVCHIDNGAASILKRFGLPRVHFVPFGTDKELGTLPEKKYDIVFFANCYDFESIWLVCQKIYSPEVIDLMHDVALEALKHQGMLLMSIFEKALKGKEHLMTAKEFPGIYCNVENYVRGKERVDLLRRLKGHEIHLFGGSVEIHTIPLIKGWKEYLQDCPNVHIHGGICYEDTLEVMKQSRFVLNSTPQFRQGFHDRVVNGMACGGISVTNDNPFIRSYFEDDVDLLLYQYNEVDALNDRLKTLLQNPAKMDEIALSGRQKVMDDHTWENRVQRLLNQYQSVRTSLVLT